MELFQVKGSECKVHSTDARHVRRQHDEFVV